LEEDRGAQIIQRQVAHFINHQYLGREVDAESAVQPSFPIGAAQIGDQIVRAHEVGSEAGMDRVDGQSHGQMRLAHARRAQKDHVAGIVDEPQRLQLTDLALVDAGLEAEVKLRKGLHKGQMGQAQPGAQVARPPRFHLPVQEVADELGINGLRGDSPLQMRFDDGIGFGQPERGKHRMAAGDHGHSPPPPSAAASYTASGRTSTCGLRDLDEDLDPPLEEVKDGNQAYPMWGIFDR
jgi:hypothetical protein